MKKIGVFLGTVPHSGGAFQYSQAIVSAAIALPIDSFEVVIAYTSELWTHHLTKTTIKHFPVADTKPWKIFERIWTLLCLPVGIMRYLYFYYHPVAKRLMEERCDLWLFPAQDTWSYQMALPALASIHDLMHHYEARFPEVSAYGRAFRRDRHYENMCNLSKGVLVDSEVGRKHVHELYGLTEEHIHILPYIAPRYMKVQEVPNGFDDRYTLPPKYLFYPAQFWEHKNHKNLVLAMAQLTQELPDINLILVGSRKNAYHRIKTLVRKLRMDEHVTFLGYVPETDMPELYRRARALVMPTYFGPTNIPPLEAFEVGCPVAISGTYGMPEQVGDAALLFDPDSVEQIREVMRRLWTDDVLCLKLKQLGKYKSANWGQKQFNERFLDIIKKVS